MKILGFIISIFFISGVKAYGQVNTDSIASDIDSVNIKIDTIKGRFIPTGIRIGLDAISAGQAISGHDQKEYQFYADIDFYRYFLNIHVGTFDGEWSNGQGVYTNTGTHFKIGPDVNFLHRDPDGSALFFGLRYAWSTFSDDFNYTLEDEVWGNISKDASNSNLTAHWAELNAGLKVRVYKLFWMGYTARFKFSVNSFEDKGLIPHWIPGYGQADENTFWSLDYWLIIRLPLPKKK